MPKFELLSLPRFKMFCFRLLLCSSVFLYDCSQILRNLDTDLSTSCVRFGLNESYCSLHLASYCNNTCILYSLFIYFMYYYFYLLYYSYIILLYLYTLYIILYIYTLFLKLWTFEKVHPMASSSRAP